MAEVVVTDYLIALISHEPQDKGQYSLSPSQTHWLEKMGGGHFQVLWAFLLKL